MPRDRQGKKSIDAPSGALLVPALERITSHPRAVWVLGGIHALVMLYIGLRYHIVGDYGVETDFFWSYVPSAEQVLNGTILIEDFRGPVYPILLALLNLFVGDYFTAGIILSTLSASAAVMAVFSLLTMYVRTDAALFGALLVASSSYVVQYTYTAGTDMLFAALLLSGAYLFLRNETARRRDLLLAALLFALAYLTRYNGIFVLVAVPAVIIVADPFSLPMKERIRTALVPLGAFFLFIAPWGIYCLIEKGSFFYSLNHLNIAYEMFAKGKVSWDEYWQTAYQTYGSLLAVVLADPAMFAGRVITNAYEHAYGDLSSLMGWILAVPALIGGVLLVRERPGKRFGAFYLFFGLNFSILLLVFYGERFSMSMLPAYVLSALWLAGHPALRRTRVWKLVPAGGLLLILLLGATVQRSYAYNREMIASGPTELLELARWTEQNVMRSEGKRPLVVSRKPHAGYYLNMDWEYFPVVQTFPELLDALRKMNADYLLFGLMEAGMRPQFQDLLDPRKAVPGLVPIVYTYAPPAVLYKVEPLSE